MGSVTSVYGHPGARQVDHLIPVTEGGDEWDIRNCRPAHGVSRRPNPCPECSPQAGQPIFCNQVRSMGSTQRARRIIAEKIAQNSGKQGATRDKPDQAAGRPWLSVQDVPAPLLRLQERQRIW